VHIIREQGAHIMSYYYIFFEDEKGESETFDYIVELSNGNKKNKSLAKSISKKFEKLQQFGTWIGMPDFRYIDSKKYSLWEIRIKFSEGYLRIFTCQNPFEKNVYVILNYFIKDGEKTPENEIVRAEKLMDSFIKRKCEENEK